MRYVGKIAACELSFIPIGDLDYREKIRTVIRMIEATGLSVEIGPMSTVVRGDFETILALIKDLYQAMDGECDFSMDIKLSNLCGC